MTYSSDEDEPDHELLALLRESLLNPSRIAKDASEPPPDTGVLKSAEFIVNNSIDVAISREHVIAAAEYIWKTMEEKHYSTQTWSEHELHPKAKDEETLNFIFVMDLLNFSFWSELPEEERFCIEYGGQKWTGYWSLVALIQRAIDEGHPITSPFYYSDEEHCSDETLEYIFRSDGKEPIPLLKERIACLREAGTILCQRYAGRPALLIQSAKNSAARLVNLLASNFTSFDDSHLFDFSPNSQPRRVNIYKRAQIFVADVWAAFDAKDFGEFNDISAITMFADYRVPVQLHYMDCLRYSPTLTTHISRKLPIPSGHIWELQLRGNAIWCVELIVKEIKKRYPESRDKINAVLVDFFLYDEAKRVEGEWLAMDAEDKKKTNHDGAGWEARAGRERGEMMPHHRTRSIWY